VEVGISKAYPVPVPPEGVSCWEYGCPTTPSGIVEGEIDRGAFTIFIF
jgi:hypothetical protein